MPSANPNPIADISPLSVQLLSEQEVGPRARSIAHFVHSIFPESAVSVYTLGSDGANTYWMPKATIGDATVHDQSIPSATGAIGALMEKSESVLLTGSALRREDYPHIDTRRTLRSLCYIPLLREDGLFGALEILSFDRELSGEEIEGLQPVAGVAAAAIASAQSFEGERHGTLTSITRLSQLYDLEKVFSSTLEMDELLPLITSKFLEILACQAVNIWLLHPDETVELLHQSGVDRTAFKGEVIKPGEGIVGRSFQYRRECLYLRLDRPAVDTT